MSKLKDKLKRTSSEARHETLDTVSMGTEIDRFSYAASWYQEASEYIAAKYEYPRLFACLLAATSPRVKIARNWRVANMIYRKWTTGHGLDLSQSMRTHHPNIKRAIRNEPLSGPKVSAFAANLTGDFQAVTIDVWVMRYYGLSGSITGKRYAELADRIRYEARKYGYQPAEYQAIIWTIVRKQCGKSYRSFLSAADVKQGLLFDVGV